jgi:S1-C subfamily serine protease
MKFNRIFLILVLSWNIGLSQSNPKNLDGYKYVYVEKLEYKNGGEDIFGLSNNTEKFLKDSGFYILGSNNNTWPKEAQTNPCLILYVLVNNSGSSKVFMEIRNCKEDLVYTDNSTSANWVNDFQDNYNRSLKNIFKRFGNYQLSYNSSKTPTIEFPEVEKLEETEESLKTYFATNSIDEIEGIYKSYQSDQLGYYMIGIKKYNTKYKAIVIDSDLKHWKLGEVKAVFEKSSVKGLYSTTWYMGNKTQFETFALMENQALLSIEFKDMQTGVKRTDKFIKLYPSTKESTSVRIDGIKATGSGFIISTDGLIATNAHVIENADRIEIHLKNEFGTNIYSASILLKDEFNDVALLKINDTEFNGFNSLPFSILQTTEIGEDVFTIGYPLNSLMGDNYKVTNGIVSSNTGLRDDVRFIQITTPIQPGNSGGPLFNKDGNVVGLTTSKLNERAVGTSIQNVNYAIKATYLINIYNMLPNKEQLSTNKTLSNMELKEQVKILKNYVCLIKVY